MIPSAAIDLMALRLGNRTKLKTDGTILTELQQTQGELEKGAAARGEIPWFLKNDIFDSGSALANDATNLDRIDMPSNFLREFDGGTLWQYDSSETNPWIELKKAPDIESLLAARDGYSSLTGVSTAYVIEGSYIVLGPLYPDSVKSYRWAYYKKDTVISTSPDTANLWLTHAPEVLMHHACINLAAFHLQNPQLAASFDALYKTAAANLAYETLQRQEANSEAVMSYTP